MSQATVATEAAPFANMPHACTKLLEAKARKGFTFEEIANRVGKKEVWLAAALYGQAKLTDDDIKKLCEVLDVHYADISSELGEHWWPHRAQLGPIPPTDPTLYRLFEGLMVYGYPIKAIIHEKFGDGIMSMVDCKIDIERKTHPKGDRVLMTFDGKFMPYGSW